MENDPNFGVPEVNNTPMGEVRMMGNFYHGLGTRSTVRPVVRFFGTLFALLFLVVPGVMWAFALVSGSSLLGDESPTLVAIGQGLFALILLLVGLKIVYNLNSRKH